MKYKENTIKKEVSFSGIGVHTGNETNIKLLPAPENTGIVFRRTDLKNQTEVPASLQYVSDTRRSTTLSKGDVHIKTGEHLLATLYAFNIDNCIIEVDGEEIPIDDGSASGFYKLIEKTGVKELENFTNPLSLSQPLVYHQNDVTITYYPSDELTITYIIDFDNKIPGTQYLKYHHSSNNFKENISSARTFILYKDVERLKKAGLIKGGSLDNAVVIRDDEILNNELRFEKEFVAHKIIDFLGDLSLLKKRISGHIIAIKAGHNSHINFIKKFYESFKLEKVLSAPLDEPVIDINAIKNYLPHRYPFLLVDKITHIDENHEFIVGVKNVTYNEQFFTGHFPEEPIMPGVLIIEAMAQTGGVLMLSTVENPSSKLVYFLSIDNVKFRKPVRPGDCLVFKLEDIVLRKKLCKMRGTAYVNDNITTEAEFKAMLVDKEDNR
jgi:UDP-3-O-[3-hydroxymyristoyl] N-acetylglucosamine deacetylase/3-hydroxyacyl-[acyl-carrier-protein] dehydratase